MTWAESRIECGFLRTDSKPQAEQIHPSTPTYSGGQFLALDHREPTRKRGVRTCLEFASSIPTLANSVRTKAKVENYLCDTVVGKKGYCRTSVSYKAPRRTSAECRFSHIVVGQVDLDVFSSKARLALFFHFSARLYGFSFEKPPKTVAEDAPRIGVSS
jgi:hypothetical protein